jgi:hypothetical protein
MFEEVNRKKKKYEVGIIIGGIIVGLAAISYLPIGSSGGPVIMVFVALGIGAIIMGICKSKIKIISNEFKMVYVQKELEKVFPNSTYHFDRGFAQSEITESRLLKSRDRYSSEDMIVGEFDGVHFKSSDVTQKEVRGSGKHRRVVTVFQGRVYEFDFNKVFKYNLLILQKGQFRPFENFVKIEMESIQFNSELKVYAKNDHEAFYILTPQFMEKLMELDRKYYDKITFSFLNNKLYIAVDNRVDNFDIKPFQIVDSSILRSYVEEFEYMKGFITLLNLTSRMFKEF